MKYERCMQFNAMTRLLLLLLWKEQQISPLYNLSVICCMCIISLCWHWCIAKVGLLLLTRWHYIYIYIPVFVFDVCTCKCVFDVRKSFNNIRAQHFLNNYTSFDADYWLPWLSLEVHNLIFVFVENRNNDCSGVDKCIKFDTT